MRSSTRVAINTCVQYVRTIVSVIITLYTSRVILFNLGVEDFGIYSLIGGVVALLAFIQNNLSRTTQRYLSYYQGKEDKKMIAKIFNNSVFTQLFISIFLCGILYLLTNVVFTYLINIPLDRVVAAKYVYLFIIGSLFFNLQSTPYLAVLVSRENIVYSSIVQMVDAFLKIPIALSLIWICNHKLEYYAAMIFVVTCLNFLFYYLYCRRKYEECKHFSFSSFDYKLSKEMLAFMGWNVYGTGCIMTRTQGTAILLNNFFGTTINAAFGISNQVSGQLSFLSNALTTAMNPQIIKAEGAGNRNRMFRLSEMSCKFSFLLMSIVSIPAIIYMPTILSLWLKDVPCYASMFCVFMVLANQIDLLTLNLNTANQAIGNVKLYNLCVNTIKVLTLPVIGIILSNGMSPMKVMIVYVTFETLCATSRLLFLRISINLSVMQYMKNVLITLIPPIFINTLICYFLSRFFTGWLFLITCCASVLTTCIVSYFFSLKKDEYDIMKALFSRINSKVRQQI